MRETQVGFIVIRVSTWLKNYSLYGTLRSVHQTVCKVQVVDQKYARFVGNFDDRLQLVELFFIKL